MLCCWLCHPVWLGGSDALESMQVHLILPGIFTSALRVNWMFPCRVFKRSCRTDNCSSRSTVQIQGPALQVSAKFQQVLPAKKKNTVVTWSNEQRDSQTALGLRTFVKPWAPEQTMESWWGPLATSQWPRPLARWVLEDGRWTNENLRIGWKWGISCQYNYQNLAINIFLNIVQQIWYVVDCWLSAWVNSR